MEKKLEKELNKFGLAKQHQRIHDAVSEREQRMYMQPELAQMILLPFLRSCVYANRHGLFISMHLFFFHAYSPAQMLMCSSTQSLIINCYFIVFHKTGFGEKR